ncbi:hypothetical protein [Flammeovirga aprica]|uniref:Uncharacterized protein n=1 Tax=Flammeovirga aprica JL-4 TaxID=694437 RepID=A0A7X9NZL5_9BACT|nr:hypothetical protein [Flammeovirga aprica]NME66590.1 hypothetical protein [Flammeovirga aprica JL-4]
MHKNYDHRITQKLIHLVKGYQTEFIEKPFGIRNRNLYFFSFICSRILPLLSIMSGVTYIGLVMNQVFNIHTALVIATVFIIGWEFLKGELMYSFFRKKFISKVNYFELSLILFLIIGSTFFSYNGATSYYHNLSDQSYEIKQNLNEQLAKIDSTAHEQTALYTLKINNLERNKKKRWGNLLTKEENEQIILYQKEINTIQNNTLTEKAVLKDKAQEIIDAKIKDAEIPLLLIGFLFAIVDLLIGSAYWYTIYYKYESIREVEWMVKSKETGNIYTESIKRHWEEETVEKPTIEIDQNEEAELKIPEDEKWIELIKALKEGGSDMRSLCRLGFNPRQIKKVKNYII